jgi:hypothetical protein
MNYQCCNTLSGNQAMARIRSEIMVLMACGGAKHGDLGTMYDLADSPDFDNDPSRKPPSHHKKNSENCNLFPGTDV